jgi:hypothetical protein
MNQPSSISEGRTRQGTKALKIRGQKEEDKTEKCPFPTEFMYWCVCTVYIVSCLIPKV